MDSEANIALAGGSGGIIGKLCFSPAKPIASSLIELSGQVHLLPCVIKHDGPCPVSDYFKPITTGEISDGIAVEQAFFRGRKLHGAAVGLCTTA
ncbi:uncharacterized protein LOC144707036 [Wolffia australiana]